MVLVNRKALTQLAAILLFGSLPATGTLVFEAEFSRMIKNLEQESFWFGKTPLSEYYKPGTTTDVIILKSTVTATPFVTFCALQLQHCFSYLTEDTYTAAYPMKIDAHRSLEQAFNSYLTYINGLPAPFAQRPLTQNDFQSVRGKAVLPELSVPKELTASSSPRQLEEARRVWEINLKSNLSCPAPQQKNRRLVSREFLFARRAIQVEWFVARVCRYSDGEDIRSVHRLFVNDFGECQLASRGYMGTTAENPQVGHVIASIQRALLTSFQD